MASDAPLDDWEYPVVLGRSLHDAGDDGDEQQQSDDVFASFCYEFQPASVDESTPGLVSVDGSRGVQVLMGSSTGAPGGVSFKGKLAEHKETDCLLIFDGAGFRLERCPFSCMQLRHVRAPTPRRRVEIQPEQASVNVDTAAGSMEPGTPASSTAGAAGTRLVGRPKGSRSKKSVCRSKGSGTAAPAAKRPRGRPKGSTKAAITAKKARLEAEAKANSEV
ncbi:chromatin modification- protein VID21 [Phytophthora pseudosyringae]|uniref:Chromatin modification- protein VID21 n=1 Tax=Phytophthora pseudosyringae TaxID=221518 RepID=A0A8T1WN58_9STRA|nr:chromatin modification- protein VID21 [Phytophthora pseudosyringae]